MSACGQNEACKGYAEGYASAKGSLEGAFGGLVSAVSNIESGMGSISIPNDYLGDKVASALDSITGGITEIQSLVDTLREQAINFADRKEKEHMEHYLKWEAEQKKLVSSEHTEVDTTEG